MHSLTSSHTFGFPVSSQSLVTVHSLEALREQLQILGDSDLLILGEGSNTIFLENYQGTILKPVLKGIEVEQTTTHFVLNVGAGENWHEFVDWCLQNDIYGLENLALIPGSVGAAPIQNIGAYGVEVEKFIHRVDYYDLAEQAHKSIKAEDCQFAYRDSVFKSQFSGKVVITNVVFAIAKKWQGVSHYGELSMLVEPSPRDIFNKVVEVRQSKLPDPRKIGNAGSFFKNPVISKKLFSQLQTKWPSMPCYPIDEQLVKVPAAWLIDTLGFKGKKIGGIGCHPNQALVLFNDGTGTGEQLLQLAREIKSTVFTEFSIELENEVRLMGAKELVRL